MKRSRIRARPADNHLSHAEWDALRHLLLTRSGGLCEARTPHCLAGPSGLLLGRPVTTSVQHRRAQGMGGTSRTDAHELANLLLLCGDGVTGCHGWIETGEREKARLRGLWVPQDIDPARVLLELSSGRLVSLAAGVFYEDRGWARPGQPRPVID